MFFKKRKKNTPTSKRFDEFRHLAYMSGVFGWTWKSFKYVCSAIRAARVTDDEIPFFTALAAWGFEASENGLKLARRTMLFMIVFFTLMSCFGVGNSILAAHNGRPLTMAGALFLAGVSMICCYVTIWRHDVLSKRRYVSLKKWAFKANPWMMGLLLLCVLFASSDVMRSFAASPVTIDLPAGVELSKKSDISGGLFASILGDPWIEITGSSLFTEGSSIKYKGLILATLEVLNTASLVYVAVFIFYLWGVFAATTAQSGKLLGGQYSSLWVPMRHAFAVSFTAPVLGGLSLMQVLIIAALSYGMNFANVIWDNSSKYIADQGNIGLVTSIPPSLEYEALDVSRVMFHASVIQEIAKNKPGEWKPVIFVRPEETVYAGGESEGYVVIRNESNKSMRMVPLGSKGMAFGELGFVVIPRPEVSIAPNTADKLQAARVKAFIELYRAMQEHARYFLQSRDYTINGPAAQPPLEEIMQVYRTSLNEAVTQYAAEVSDGETARKLIRASLDVADSNGGSVNGWATAGLFTFSIANMQKQLDELMFSSSEITEANVRINVRTSEGGVTGFFKSVYGYVTGTLTVEELEETLITESSSYFNDVVAHRTRYVNHKGSLLQDSWSAINWALSLALPENALVGSNDGLLKRTITTLTVNDPIVVLTNMGSRLTAVGMTWIAGALATNAADAALDGNFVTRNVGLKSISGPVRAVFNFGPLMALACLSVSIGFLLTYLVPAIPAIFWIRAVLSWVYLVIESLVAAPFWVTCHAMPEGHGFAGQTARRGYMLFIDIMIRPVLLVIGAVFSIVLIQAWGVFLNKVLSIWLNTLGDSLHFSPFAEMAYSFIVIYICYTSCYTIFVKGVNHLPLHVSRWVGGGGMSLDEEGEATSTTRAMAGIFVSTGGRGLQHVASIGKKVPAQPGHRGGKPAGPTAGDGAAPGNQAAGPSAGMDEGSILTAGSVENKKIEKG